MGPLNHHSGVNPLPQGAVDGQYQHAPGASRFQEPVKRLTLCGCSSSCSMSSYLQCGPEGLVDAFDRRRVQVHVHGTPLFVLTEVWVSHEPQTVKERYKK